MKLLYFFGDSLTLGVNDTRVQGGWVSRLALEAAGQGLLVQPPDTIYNLGVRRHSSRDVRERWETELECRGFPGAECYVFFCFGVVDAAAPKGAPNVPVEEFQIHARDILTRAGGVTCRAAVISAPPVSDAAHCARVGQLNAVLDQLCTELNITFIPLFESLLDSEIYMGDLKDGLHPGPVGCQFMAEMLRPAVQRLLEE